MSIAYTINTCFVWQRAEQVVANRNVHPVHIEIYDLIAITDMVYQSTVVTPYGTYPGNHPLALLTLEQALEGDNVGSATGSQININDLEFQPERSFRLQQHWKIVNRKRCVLTPGDELHHITFHKKNFIVDEKKYTIDLEMLNGGYVKNVSTCTLYRVRGRLGHLSDEQPTWQGVELDTAVKYKHYIREHVPFKDYFAQEYSESFWPGEATPTNTTSVSAYVQNNPDEQPGDAIPTPP